MGPPLSKAEISKLRAMHQFENIPSELRQYRHWVCWRGEWKSTEKAKLDKLPINPTNGRAADVNDPSTWGSFEQARTRFERDQSMSGIGFVFSEEDPFVGVDLDNCRDPETGALTEETQAFIEGFKTYSEISPSRKGIKLFCRGMKPGTSCRKGDIEIYDHGRFFTVTGRILE